MVENLVTVEEKIRQLADRYSENLAARIDACMAEMDSDDRSYYLIYRVLGVTHDEGNAIDLYQNKGRFLYNYAGAFLEEAVKLCFLERYPDSGSIRIPNTLGQRPRTFEIDCLIDQRDAIEIK